MDVGTNNLPSTLEAYIAQLKNHVSSSATTTTIITDDSTTNNNTTIITRETFITKSGSANNITNNNYNVNINKTVSTINQANRPLITNVPKTTSNEQRGAQEWEARDEFVRASGNKSDPRAPRSGSNPNLQFRQGSVHGMLCAGKAVFMLCAGKAVFMAERVMAAGGAWHKACFTCQECNKRLDSHSIREHERNIYCN
ncbi:hypothetical protein HAZT_HAZT011140, partial [Hyalella azteca]